MHHWAFEFPFFVHILYSLSPQTLYKDAVVRPDRETVLVPLTAVPEAVVTVTFGSVTAIPGTVTLIVLPLVDVVVVAYAPVQRVRLVIPSRGTLFQIKLFHRRLHVRRLQKRQLSQCRNVSSWMLWTLEIR